MPFLGCLYINVYFRPGMHFWKEFPILLTSVHITEWSQSAQSKFLMYEAGLEDAVQELVECASAAKGIELKTLDHRQSEIKQHKTHLV